MKIKVQIGEKILETNDIDLAIMAIKIHSTCENQRSEPEFKNLDETAKPKKKVAKARWRVNAMQTLTENLHLTPTDLKKLPELSKFSLQQIGQKKYTITSKK